MLFKPDLIELILAGKKRQTRRPVQDGERLIGFRPGTHYRNCVVKQYPDGTVRLKWKVGNTYAVQPVGKPQVARIRILHIYCQDDVRTITHEDVIGEGFHSKIEFLDTWCQFYDIAVTHRAWVLIFKLAPTSP